MSNHDPKYVTSKWIRQELERREGGGIESARLYYILHHPTFPKPVRMPGILGQNFRLWREVAVKGWLDWRFNGVGVQPDEFTAKALGPWTMDRDAHKGKIASLKPGKVFCSCGWWSTWKDEKSADWLVARFVLHVEEKSVREQNLAKYRGGD